MRHARRFRAALRLPLILCLPAWLALVHGAAPGEKSLPAAAHCAASHADGGKSECQQGQGDGDGHDHSSSAPRADSHEHIHGRGCSHVPVATGCSDGCGEEGGSHGATESQDHADEEGHSGCGGGDHDHAGEEGHVDEVALTPEALRDNGIRVERVRKHALSESYAVPGRVSYNAEAMAHVGTPVEGRVAEVRVKLGDAVRKGDPLLTIDSPALGEAQSAYLHRRTEAEVSASALEIARSSCERAKRLLEEKAISLNEYQRVEGEYKAAAGDLRCAESSLKAARNLLHLHGMSESDLSRLVSTDEIDSRYSVRAPIDGRVVGREATLGEVVGPERDALLVLADMSVLWVLADVPEGRIREIAPGTPALVTVEALGDQSLSGKVSYVAPELNRETRTVQVRIEVEGGNAPIKPGMFAQVLLGLGQTAGASATARLAVPERAVQNFEGGQAVFVALEDRPGVFAARPVVVGPPAGRMVPILAGIEEGALVVVDGAFVIKAELAKGAMEGKTCSGH